MMECTLDSSVPDWVIEHPETLAVFQNLGIDYCCGGKSLEFACREQGLDVDTVLKSLFWSIEANRNNDHDAKLKHAPFAGGHDMAIPHIQSGEVIYLSLGTALSGSKTTTLVKTTDLELIRLIVPAGKVIPLHKAPGEITVQCLEGRVAFTAEGKTQELTAGQLLYLTAGEPHALTGLEDSSLLVTLLLPKGKPHQIDAVQSTSD